MYNDRSMPPPITLGVVPSVTPGDSRSALRSLCDALGAILGREVIGAHPPTYDELASAMATDRVHYAWMPPVLLILTTERVRLQPLLSAVRGERTDYCSVLFVDAHRPFHRIDDLRGRTVAWVDTASASGYLCPRLHLAAQGIDPSRLFGSELFLRSHADVVRAVLDGRADVGATYAERPAFGEPIRRAGFRDVAPDREVRILAWTTPIPNDVLAGHGLVGWTEHRAFSSAILALTERDAGRKLLYGAFHAERFAPTRPETLRPLMDLVGLARANGLLPQL
jgi:phosphonate transport system substrate-binding protein